MGWESLIVVRFCFKIRTEFISISQSHFQTIGFIDSKKAHFSFAFQGSPLPVP